jgi:hypothetical protein
VRPWVSAGPPMPKGVVPLGGTDYNQAEVLRAVDGDSARLHRRRFTVEEVHSEDLGALISSEFRVRVWEDDVLELPDGAASRLVNLNTPELNSSDPAERERARKATADLAAFIDAAGDGLRCVTYDEGGGFDRLLVDLYVDVEGGRATATEWMLSLGWSPYLGKAQRAAPRTVAG